jgi:type I restriction enzyme R subunit
MAGFSEASTVQDWLVKHLQTLGWTYVRGNELPRTRTDVFVDEWLLEALEVLNPDIHGFPERVDEVMPIIRSAALAGATDGLVPANERMVEFLRGARTVRYIGTEHDVPVRLIDFGAPDDLRQGKAPAENDYVVSDEVTFGPPGKERRFDVVLFVNGFPLVVIETKTPVNASVSWYNAAKDLANIYCVEHPTFFVPNVLMVATEGREYRFGAVGQIPEEWELWGSTDDAFDLDGLPRVKRSVELQLTPARVLSVLRDFTLFENTLAGQKRKLLPRYPQVEATEAIFEKVLTGRPGGLIEHYQGTGKTLLQAFAAVMLLRDDRIGGPTVICVVDRLDLIEQTQRQFTTAGLPRLTVATSKAHLRQLLAEDFRGIIMTTIHRFDRENKAQPPPVLNRRSNIVVTVDEAHRTTEGSLGDDMRAALPHARFFGLTGSPVAEKDRNTFKLFGDPNDPGYVMSRYEPERSIADGASVPIHVEPRLVDFHLNKAALDEAFKELVEQEGLTEEQIDFLSGKAASVKTLMMNPDRIRAVCEDIVDHYTMKVAPLGMKAMVVAYDRELVVAYETEIQKILTERGHPYGVEVVMSVGSGKNEPAAWQKYALSREQEADVKRRFNDAKNPLTFVIVTAKFLTGFDAPILFAQYLDRPLRKVTLFQAITRPNRNWTNPETKQRKRYGLVVDYVGLGEEIGKALAPADPTKGGKRPVDVDDLADTFVERITETLDRFHGIDRAATDFETLSAARDRLPPGDERDKYAREFTALETMWEFLDPHPVLAEYQDDYKWLAKVYEAVKPTKVSNDILWARLGAKTLELVHGHISDVTIKGTGLEEVVVDPEAIQAIKQLILDERAKNGDGDDGADGDDEAITVAEVLDTIDARIKRRFDKSGAGIYKTLAERIDQLRAQALQKVGDSVDWIKKALEVAKLMVQAEKMEDEGTLDEAALLVDPNIGALTQIVEEYKPESAPVVVEDLAHDIDAIVKQVRFTGWNRNNPDGDKLVRRNIRDVLGSYGLPPTGPLFDNTYAYVSENY